MKLTTSNTVRTICLLPLLLAVPSANSEAQQTENSPVGISLDRPFLFTYGTWDKKAQINNGEVDLDAAGLTPKGGAGSNLPVPMIMSTYGDDCPALTLLVGPRNTLKTLNLMLGDTNGHTSTWHFTLPASANTQPVVLTPIDGASLSQPNEVGKTGSIDLGHVTQWQLMGDWSGDGAVDVRVNSIGSVAPNAAINQSRQVLAQRQAEQQNQARIQRESDRLKYKPGTAQSPIIQAVYVAAPGILAIRIHSGKITPSSFSHYAAGPGDTVSVQNGTTYLMRNGQQVGNLVGPKHDALSTFEGFSGDPLLTTEADDPANYSISSAGDPNYVHEVTALSVSRKSKPDDWQQPKRPGLTVLHTIYLKLPKPLVSGQTYSVTMKNINAQKQHVTLLFDPTCVRSESVHVSQIGFRPSDPAKRAFLSLWTGDNGGVTFADGTPFRLVNTVTSKIVYTGRVGTGWPAEKPEAMNSPRNFNGTAVYPMDFSGFKTPGTYRVSVDGVGCSFPFEIGDDVWKKAFQTQMKGFYNQRSGVALGPPYTAFVRPADFRPGVNDTVSITQSNYSNLDGGDSQKDLAKGDTGVAVPGAWGGYHDAGDWNPRRISHMRTTTFWQLELLDLFPNYFSSLSLNIPESAHLPDLLSECLFELSLFQRLQKRDGGVPFGIETNGDPLDGEVSWHQSMPAYVYAPDAQSSYIYASVASRAALVLAAYDPAEAKLYHDSALKAMEWAEADRQKRIAQGTWGKLPGDVTEDRNLAAVCLLALTRDARWNRIFLEDTTLARDKQTPFVGSLMRRDAAFTYARLPSGVGDATVKSSARTALIRDADGTLAVQEGNAWGIASDDPGKPLFLGFFSAPQGGVSLLRAYTLTHGQRYLAGAVRASLFSGGANPNNLVYTTGVGSNPIRHPLNLDSRQTGQAAPVGLTVYGNVDLARWGNQSWITWPIIYFLGAASKPSPFDWPTTEAYFDVYMMPALTEFTMDQTMGPNAYVWGYLAARK